MKRFLSIFLTVAVMASMIMVPSGFSVAAAATETLIHSEDFEDPNIPNVMNSKEAGGWYHDDRLKEPGAIKSNYVGLVTGYGDEGNALVLDCNVERRMFEWVVGEESLTALDETKIYKLAFDFRPGESGFELMGYRGATGWADSGKTIMTVEKNTLEPTVWYKVEVYLDLANDTARHFVKDADGNIVKCETVAYNESATYTLQFYRTGLITSSAVGNLEESIAIDNMMFYSTTEFPDEPGTETEPGEEKTFPYEYDFEDENIPNVMNSSDVGGWANGEQLKVAGAIKSNGVNLVTGYMEEGNALVLDANAERRMFEFVVGPESLTALDESKIYKLTFDIKMSESGFELMGYRGSTGWADQGKSIMSIAANELDTTAWYNVEVYLDLANNQARHFIKDTDGEVVKFATSTYDESATYTLQFYRTGIATSTANGNLDKSIAIDNLVFDVTETVPEEPTEPEPGTEVEVELKSLSNGTATITSVAQVATDTDININFDYKNNTGSEQTLYIVVSYYNGDTMLMADRFVETVDKNITAKDYALVYRTATEDEIAGFNKVKVMIWTGWGTLVPMSAALEIK